MKEKKSTWKLLRSLLKMYATHKKEICIIVIGSILSVATELCYPYLMRDVLDNIFQLGLSEAIPKLVIVGAILGALMVADVIVFKIMMVDASVMYDRINYELQQKIYGHIQRMSFSWFDNNKTGELISILDGDTNAVGNLVSDVLPDLVTSVLQVVGAVIVFWNIGPSLMKLLLPLLAVIFWFETMYSPKLRKRYGKLRELRAKQMEVAEDTISGIRTTIGFGMEQAEADRFDNGNKNIMEQALKKWKSVFVHKSTYNALTSLYYNIMMIGGCVLAIKGAINITDMVLFYMYSYLITSPIDRLSDMSKHLNECLASYERITNLLDQKSEIVNCDKPLTPTINGEVEFNNVTFNYKGSNTILNKFNLKVKKGEFLAVVGMSGVGKSTIAGLIPRYYDVNDGQVLIDGIDVKHFDLHYLRRNVGMVQQEPYLFNGTIIDNIKYGCPDATLDQVIEAAKNANAHEFISRLADGYNSEVGERGIKLSGGQKQRIAIARLFLENPPIMIFDEATSSLDNESEKEVQKALDILAKDRTTIVIAHKLNTIQNADRIVLLTEDGIVEEGKHDNLIQLGGQYSKLYAANKK